MRLSAFFSLALLLALVASACAPAVYEPSEPNPSGPFPSARQQAGDGVEASSPRGRVEIVEVYGRRSLRVGEVENFRVRLAPGFAWPLQYAWDFGDGIISVGNNVTHRFTEPGTYPLTVVARNDVNSDTAYASISVAPAPTTPPIAPPPPSEPVAAVAPFNPGDIVWVAGIYPQPDSAGRWASVFTDAGLRAAVLPTVQGQDEAFLVAIGGYQTEAEAQRARGEVLQARDVPLWLLRLDERRRPR